MTICVSGGMVSLAKSEFYGYLLGGPEAGICGAGLGMNA